MLKTIIETTDIKCLFDIGDQFFTTETKPEIYLSIQEQWVKNRSLSDKQIDTIRNRIISAYTNERWKQSEHIGAVGYKQHFGGHIITYNQYQTDYGTSISITILTEDNNRLHMQGNGAFYHTINRFDYVEFIATIKDHSVRAIGYQKTTHLTRPKIKYHERFVRDTTE